MKNKLLTLVIVILTSLTVIQLFSRVFHSPLDFDEGYNLQVVQQIAQSGKYATFDGLLDVNITTGPTVLLPAALLYSQQNPLLTRGIVVLFSLALLLYAVFKYFENTSEKIIHLLLINVTPLYFLFGSQILGELPGFVFLFFAYALLSRAKYVWAGVFFALSILTKSTYIYGILPIVFIVLVDIFQKKKLHFYFKKGSAFLLGAFIPLMLWEGYQFSQLNFDAITYWNHAEEFFHLLRSKGGTDFRWIEKRLEMVGYSLYIGGTFFLFLGVFTSLYSYVSSVKLQYKLLALYTFFTLVQYFVLGATPWYRHMFPSLLGLLFVIPVFSQSFFKSLNLDKKILLGAFIPVFLVSILNFIYKDPNYHFVKKLTVQNLLFLDQSNKPYLHPKAVLIDQRDMARYIDENIDESKKISGFEWVNSPEISYLANRRIYRDALDLKSDYILLGIYNIFLDPNSVSFIQNAGLQRVHGNNSYELYTK